MVDMTCKVCDKIFGSEAAFMEHNKAKHDGEVSKQFMSSRAKSSVKRWGIVFVLLVIIGGCSYLFFQTSDLPPTDIQGHIEESPSSHVLKEQMPLAVQKHMLEHSDGKGPPGVIINYNCVDFECEPGLVEKLEKFVEIYPAFLYVAPFDDMDAKITLTKFGKIEVLDAYDETRIDRFIKS